MATNLNTSQGKAYDPSEDAALIEVGSMTDENSSEAFVDYSPTDEQVEKWFTRALIALGAENAGEK
jgi:hypothetical protein